MRLLLTGGGTAGHVTPALAIAEIFKRNRPDTEILFIGTKKGIESRLVAEAGYPFFPISVIGLSRSLSPKNLQAIYLALAAKVKLKRLLRELRPDIVVGTGGYVSFPVLSAAAALGIPTALHESNAIPGLTVRHLARKVDLLLLNFGEVEGLVSARGRVVQVGNPLRGNVSKTGRLEARARLGIPPEARLLLSFGGSLGAEAMNNAVLSLWQDYVLKEESVYHIHGTGARYAEEFKRKAAALAPLPERIRIYDYITEMPLLMAAADLILCRAGAMTVSEVARAGRAAIFVPSPNVAADHQRKNAEVLERAGAALLLLEEEMEKKLLPMVKGILEDRDRRAAMEAAIAEFASPEANRSIYRELCCLMKKK